MTSLSSRRARIARIRSFQLRAAGAQAALAEAALANLNKVSTHLQTLHVSLSANEGPTLGQSLRASSELRCRLTSAQAGLAYPTQEAKSLLEQRTTEHRNAHIREQSALKLQENAEAVARAEAALRDDARRPVVKRQLFSGEPL
jgi:hypothetical protein